MTDARTIVALAHSCKARVDFERALLDDILLHVGADVGAFRIGSAGSPTVRGFSMRIMGAGSETWARHARELAPVLATAAQDGATVDVDVLGERRVRSTRYFSEVVRPHGGRETLFAVPMAAATPTGCLLLGRGGARGRFRPGDVAAVRELLPAIAVASAAVAALHPEHLRAALSPREAEIIEFLSLGWRSRDIAAALGTSVNTVRNQVSRLMVRLGVATRAELIAVVHPHH
jgi:DNA-binding CsgD family transcriptional regulator